MTFQDWLGLHPLARAWLLEQCDLAMLDERSRAVKLALRRALRAR